MLKERLAREEVELLFLTANEMLRMDDETELYAYTARNLANFYPDTAIVLMKVLPWEDGQPTKAELVHIGGISSSFLSKVTNVVGYKIEGKVYDIHTRDVELWKHHKLVQNEGGFVEFFGDQMKTVISKSLEKLYGLHKIYSIGIHNSDELLAFIHLYTRNKQEINSPVFLEAFVQQAGIIISQLRTRRALQKSERKLIRLSESLTVLNKTRELSEAYDYVTGALQKAYSDSLIMYTPIDEENRKYSIASMAGLERGQLEMLNQLSGYRLIDKEFDMSESRRSLLRKGELVLLKDAFKSFEGPEFSVDTAKAIEKALNIKRLYSIGLIMDEILIGAIYIVLRKDYQYPEKRFIETLTRQIVTIIAIIESRHALMKNEAELRKMNADKDRFMRVLAHDLRSPFNSIVGYSSLLVANADKYDSQKIRDIGSMLSKTSKRTYELLEDILKWAGANEGTLEVRCEPIILEGFIDQILEVLSGQAAQKNVKFKTAFRKELSIDSDPEMLRTIIRNLVSNAIKFSYQGNEVTVKTTLDKNRNVVISVTDQGIGMTREEVDSLWDPATKVSKPGTNDERGTGFGLVVCKDFVNALGGEITVESQSGKGTSIYVKMPLEAQQ